MFIIFTIIIMYIFFSFNVTLLYQKPYTSRLINRYKNVPTHPYRVHPKVQLKAIPTIMLWKEVKKK